MSISNSRRFLIFERDGFTCRYCGRRAPDVPLQADHVHPKSKGGSDHDENLVTACVECNQAKRDRVLKDLWTPKELRRAYTLFTLCAAFRNDLDGLWSGELNELMMVNPWPLYDLVRRTQIWLDFVGDVPGRERVVTHLLGLARLEQEPEDQVA